MQSNNPHLVIDESTFARPEKDPKGMKIVPPGVEYHRVLAGEKRRIGRGILAITWRSGGIEIAVVLHAAFNTLSFVFAVGMSGDLTAGLDRTVADPASGIALIGPCLVVIGTLVVVWLRTRRTGPITTPAVEPQRPANFTS